MILLFLINIFRAGVKWIRPDSFWWHIAAGQGAVGTNWNIEYVNMRKKNFLSFKGLRALEQAALRDGGVSCPGDNENPPGCFHVQLKVGPSSAWKQFL